jgi:hypothetical protein
VVRRPMGESRAAATARGARFVATHEPPAPAGATDRHHSAGLTRAAPPAPSRPSTSAAASSRPACRRPPRACGRLTCWSAWC